MKRFSLADAVIATAWFSAGLAIVRVALVRDARTSGRDFWIAVLLALAALGAFELYGLVWGGRGTPNGRRPDPHERPCVPKHRANATRSSTPRETPPRD